MHILAEYKQNKQTLRYLAMIAEGADEGIVVADINGILRFVNTAWAGMHGYKTKNELIGKPISFFHTKEQMERDVMPLIKEAKRRGRLEGPVEHIKNDGTPFSTQTKMTLIKNETGQATGLIIFSTDITQRKQPTETLRENAPKATESSDKIKQLENQISEHNQAAEQLRQQNTELTDANEKFRQEINELNQLLEKRDQYLAHLEQQNTNLSAMLVEDPVKGPKLPEDVLDTERLKELSILARRLANRS